MGCAVLILVGFQRILMIVVVVVVCWWWWLLLLIVILLLLLCENCVGVRERMMSIL